MGFLVSGLWSLVFGLWSLVFGLWSLRQESRVCYKYSMLTGIVVVATALLQPVTPSAGSGEAFHARLVSAVSQGNRRQVATMFRYPARVTVGGLAYPVAVENSAALLQMYDLFFTPEMRCAIEQSRTATPSGPRPKFTLLAADGVVSLADGRIVAERTAAGYKITRMTILGQPGTARSEPRKVVFRWGQGETQYAGRLGGDDIDRYMLSVRKGELLQARIERFPGRALALRVVEQRTGRVLEGAPSEFARTWGTRITETGDYRVEVVRRASFCEPSNTYLLTLAVRG